MNASSTLILRHSQFSNNEVHGGDGGNGGSGASGGAGNFGIGGAWVGPRMGYRSMVVLPAEMSAERFEKIEAYGAEVIPALP